MKYLDYSHLESINLFLRHLNLGESTLKGSIEAYSCKHTVTDRKQSLSLEHEILDYLGQSSDSDPPSPVDYLASRSSRKTLIYLVLTLGHMYPDYDFSAVKAHLFFREERWENFKQIFDNYMFEAEKEWALANGGSSLLDCISKAIGEIVKLSECEIYSYNLDVEGEPMERGALWSFNFFFYNKKLKRVVSFRCCCLSNLAEEGFLAGGALSLDDNDDVDIFDDMDM
ncbi:hypothetical protein QJS04_geneDACA022615 [Acorus gramineus]|uniref:Repressor of RNA polymerase III transcription n=1 Tax=Acorus gramineus TaxID=55184 RepID=A0AAV9B3G0_ACOGR|nr:hypothetical protein QJS04_geneDACA022615 [Acorus gramineus]